MNFTQKKDYYKILNIPNNATLEEIKKSYRKLSKENHPDKNSSIDSERLQTELNEAYHILKDPCKRKEYDKDTPENRIIKQADKLILNIFKDIIKSTFDKNTLFVNAQLAIDENFKIDDSAIEKIKKKIQFLNEVKGEKVTESKRHLKSALDHEIKTLETMIEHFMMKKAIKLKAIEILQRDYKKEKQTKLPTGFLDYTVADQYQNINWRKLQ